MNTQITIRPDIIVTWPRNCDYPTWRHFIRTNRPRFNEIIVVFMQPNQGEDYRDFVRQAMFEDYVHFVDSRPVLPGEDWRNVAINQALMYSYNSQWVWFTEQDFMVMDDRFWQEVYYKASINFELIGIAQGGRLHPASIFTKREVLNMTHKDFSARPPMHDHFGQFQIDVEKLGINRVYMDDEEKWGYKHYNGLSHNWNLTSIGQEPVYKPEEFKQWLKMCLDLPKEIKLDDRFINVANTLISRKNDIV